MEPNQYQPQPQPTTFEPTLFSRYSGPLSRAISYLAAASVVGYFGVSLVGGSLTVGQGAAYEHFNPRKVRQHNQEMIDRAKQDGEVVTIEGSLVKAAEFPWKMFGFVTSHQYLEARTKAFEVAGIDENNPLHDPKRFHLYRQLGFAVLQSEDRDAGIYVPFRAWVDYIEGNSSFRNSEWTGSRELKLGGKVAGQLRGEAFFKADSTSQSGNGSGVAERTEWNRALNTMGYTTMDDLIDEVRRVVESDNLNFRESIPDSLVDLNSSIPNLKLEEFIRSQ